MRLPSTLKTVSLDVETGELKINNEQLENVSDFALTFNSGIWELNAKQTKAYATKGMAMQNNITKE